MTEKLLTVLGVSRQEPFYKALQKVEMEKVVYLFGLVEMEEEIMTIVIVMATPIRHGHFRWARPLKMD